MKFLLQLAAAVTALLVLAGPPASAQVAGVLNYWNQTSGNWDVPANWSLSSVPNGQTTDDFAVIGGVNGINGVAGGAATVNSAVAPMPGGIALGLAAGNAGTLSIVSGGSLTAADTAFDGNGSVNVGVAGVGTLNVERGGSLAAVSLSSGGGTTSTVTLGSVAGSGLATVAVQNASLGRVLRVIGPNVDFSAADTLELQPTHNLVAQITNGTTHSALKAGAAAVLGGALTVQFDPGVTPAVNNSWNLFDAGAVIGAFAAVNTSSAPELPLGQVYAVRTVNGGTNGKLVQLAVEQRLVLNVNRNTGAMTLSNPGPGAIAIDGVTIGSATVGALNAGAWNAIDGTWQTANSSANRLSQVRPAGSTTINGSGTQALGALFAPPAPAAFGTYAEDLAFQYTQPDGSTRTGVINYTGTGGINNLTLLVDPATGKAQLRNTSPFNVAIDAYTISSPLGSLDVSQWSSLDDQNAAGGNWTEANVSATRLSELKPTGSTPLGPGASLNLGNPFNEATGKKDLAFQFLLSGEETTRTGMVVYGSIGVPGDFDGNGTVNGADLTKWRGDFGVNGNSDADGDGDSDGADFLVWQRNLGMAGATAAGAAATAAVPEPESWMFALATVPAIALRQRNR